MMEAVKEIFGLVANHLRTRVASLEQIKRVRQTGIECWFKVEVVAALGDRVMKLQNKVPDLILDGGSEIGLKADTDFASAKIFQGYSVPILFPVSEMSVIREACENKRGCYGPRNDS